jgi:hypothetical protein
MSTKPQGRDTLASNPLHQEEPARKRRRLSHSESSLDDSEEDAADSPIHSDPEDNVDSNYIHSDFIVEDRLGSSGQHENLFTPQKLLPSVPPSFSSLGISVPLQSALKSMSIKSPTEVQVACIPPLLAGMYIFPSRKYKVLNWSQNRQRLYWKCPNWFRENDCICIANPSETLSRSLWYICPGVNTYEVRKSSGNMVIYSSKVGSLPFKFQSSLPFSEVR